MSNKLVSRAEEENYELDMYIFGRYQYRSNTDKRMDEGSQEKPITRRKKNYS